MLLQNKSFIKRMDVKLTFCVGGKHQVQFLNEKRSEKITLKLKNSLKYLDVVPVFVEKTKVSFLLSK